MEKIYFFKDGSERIALGDVTYKPYTLEQILNIPSMFYKVFSEEMDENGEIVESQGTTEWFNYKGLTYVKE